MKKINSICFVIFFFIYSLSVQAQSEQTVAPTTDYAPVNGLKMYYEIHGTGKPLILLHGSHATAATTFGKLLPELKKHYKVIAVELQGHGHTADINRPISCKAMAGDVAALIKFLKLDKVDVLGYSMGSGVALNLAMMHPGQVGKMVLLSPVYKATGIQPAYWTMLPNVTPEVFEGSPVKLAYDSIAPDQAVLSSVLDTKRLFAFANQLLKEKNGKNFFNVQLVGFKKANLPG